MYFLGNGIGYMSEGDGVAWALQVVNLQSTAEGAWFVEFNVYVEYAEGVENRPPSPTISGMDGAPSSTSETSSNYYYLRFTPCDDYVWYHGGSMNLILGIICSSLVSIL
jgi:hypothetical protein